MSPRDVRVHFDCPEIEALIAAAVELAKLRPDPDAKGAMIIKAEEQKQILDMVTRAAFPRRAAGEPLGRFAGRLEGFSGAAYSRAALWKRDPRSRPVEFGSLLVVP